MSKGFESPLKRAQAGKIGGKKVDEPVATTTTEHNNVLTQQHTNVKTSIDQGAMKRQTVYMPEELALWLKIHAASTKDDISGIITRLVEDYREKIEGE